jgi:hypothetical protein
MRWMTTGSGEAVMRWLAGRTCGPPASSTRRKAPAMAGNTTTDTSANGTHPVDRVDPVDRVVRAVACVVTWRRPGRAAS